MKNILEHEVYCVIDNAERIIYIGSGKINRHKHCLSGCSHVYELNRMHFAKENLYVKIIKANLSKEDSFNLEKELILKHRPHLNKQFLSSDTRKESMKEGRELRLLLTNYIATLEAVDGNPSDVLKQRFTEQVIEFVNLYKVDNLIKGVRVSSTTKEKLQGNRFSDNRYKLFNALFEKITGVMKFNDELINLLTKNKDEKRNIN